MFPEAVMSSAESLTGDLSIGHRNTSLGPVGLVEGAAPPAFRHTRTAVASHHTYHLTPSGLNQINLEFNATDLINTARSSGFGVDSIGTQATADIGSANIIMLANMADVSALGLSVAATFIHSESDASYVFGANSGFLVGDASFGSLTIGGALIGTTLTFSGDAAPNTVLFHNATVTITLDKQTLSDFLPPSPLQSIAPNQITTDALDIHLTNAQVFGKTISGDIVLGQSSARLFPPLHA